MPDWTDWLQRFLGARLEDCCKCAIERLADVHNCTIEALARLPDWPIARLARLDLVPDWAIAHFARLTRLLALDRLSDCAEKTRKVSRPKGKQSWGQAGVKIARLEQN